MNAITEVVITTENLENPRPIRITLIKMEGKRWKIYTGYESTTNQAKILFDSSTIL